MTKQPLCACWQRIFRVTDPKDENEYIAIILNPFCELHGVKEKQGGRIA